MARFMWSLLVSTAVYYGELYAFRSEGEPHSPISLAENTYHTGPLRRGQIKEDSKASSPSADGSRKSAPQPNQSSASVSGKEGSASSSPQNGDKNAETPVKTEDAAQQNPSSKKKNKGGNTTGNESPSDQKVISAENPATEILVGRQKINCFKYFASSLGSIGAFSPNPHIYRQIYVKSKLSDGYAQILEEVNIKDKSTNNLLTLKIPKVDVMTFEGQEGAAEGVSLIQYKSNLDNCFHGNGTVMAFPLKRSRVESEVPMLKHTGRLATLSDLNSIWRFWDESTGSLVNFQFDTLMKRTGNLRVNNTERVVAIGLGANKKPFYAFKYPDAKAGTPPSLISYDLNGSVAEKLDLGEGEKFILSRQKLGKLVYSEKSSKMSLLEFKNWGSGRKDATFAFDFPKGFFPHQAEFFVNFEKRILVASGQGNYFKTFWKTVLVIDYSSGAVISKLRLISGVAGQVALNDEGTFAVVEEVAQETGERLKLHFLDIVSGKWHSIDYKK